MTTERPRSIAGGARASCEGSGGTLAPLTGVSAIAAGYEHSLALAFDGTVLAWGDRGGGKLGDGSDRPVQPTPDFVRIPCQDTTPPALLLPAAIDAVATSAAGAAVSFTARAEDSSGAPLEVSCSGGATFPLGTTEVACSAVDACGNSGAGRADAGNFSRYDATDDQYVFNLDTTPLGEGSWRLWIDLGDGVERWASFSLRR